MSFAPCPSCGRHVKLIESTCPFCSHGTKGLLVATPTLPGRVTRAAIYAFTTTLAVAGCTSGSPTSSSGTSGISSSSGGSSSSGASSSSSGESSSGVAPAYGAPAPDPTDGGTSTSSSGNSGAYGGPPVDAGK
jgi:hypothetical protein